MPTLAVGMKSGMAPDSIPAYDISWADDALPPTISIPPQRQAMKAVPASRSIVFLSIAILGCALDLWTKNLVFNWLGMPGGPTYWLWPKEVVGFQTSLNEGALFGLGQGFVPVFAALSIAAAIGIFIWLFYAGAAKDWLLTIALGCVTAGIFGNLHDRLGLMNLVWPVNDGVHVAGQSVHAVRDYILVMIGTWRWPNFNVADSLLVCGAILLFWHAFRGQPEPEVEADSEKPVVDG
jgi:signal peptidase II